MASAASPMPVFRNMVTPFIYYRPPPRPIGLPGGSVFGCLLTLRCLAGPILSGFYQQNLETASHNVSKYPLQIVFYQQFDNLYTFQGRPVTDIVGTDPETETHAVIATGQLMDTQIV